jgi:hypothetical protein
MERNIRESERKRQNESEIALSIFFLFLSLRITKVIKKSCKLVFFQRLTSVAAMATLSEFISFWKKRMRLEERAYDNIYSGPQSDLKLHIWEGSKLKGPTQPFSVAKGRCPLYKEHNKKRQQFVKRKLLFLVVKCKMQR